MGDHPIDDDLEAFLSGRLPPAERKVVLLHLSRGCANCRRRLARLGARALGAAPARAAKAAPDYDSVLDRAFAAARGQGKVLEGERRSANRDMAHLLNLAADLATSEGSPTGSWALVLELLAQSHELRFRDPAGMVRFAEMAQVVAARLRPEEYGERPIADLRARVYAGLANAQRVAEDLAAAQRAINLAEEARQEGTGDLMIKAHLLNLDAALRRDQERSGEALSLLRRAHGIYAELGERHLAGRVLVSQALCHGYREELSEALRLLTLGSAQIDPDRDPPLAALAEQNICWVLTHLGRFLEVKERLARSDLRRVLAGEPLNLLRLDWLEGRVALGMGDSARAESLLQKVHGALLEAGKGRDARRVASDLAALHSGEWRTTGLRI